MIFVETKQVGPAYFADAQIDSKTISSLFQTVLTSMEDETFNLADSLNFLLVLTQAQVGRMDLRLESDDHQKLYDKDRVVIILQRLLARLDASSSFEKFNPIIDSMWSHGS